MNLFTYILLSQFQPRIRPRPSCCENIHTAVLYCINAINQLIDILAYEVLVALSTLYLYLEEPFSSICTFDL